MSDPIYALLQVKVTDRDKLKTYIDGHLPSLRQYGGHIVVRGQVTTSAFPELLVVHRWPSEEAFRTWEESPEYRPWREMRDEACEIIFTVAKALD